MTLDPMKTSLPPAWTLPFTLRLREMDVTGAAIGDALRQVESFCVESGQTPEEAFGDPVAYAASLTALPTVPTGGLAGRLTERLAPTLLGLAGLLLAMPTVEAWRAGRSVSISAGLVVAFAVTALVVLVVLVRPGVLRRRAGFGALVAVAWAAAVIAPITLTATVLRLPLPLAGVLATLALVGSGLWSMRTIAPDVIADPLAPPREPSPGVRAFLLLTAWLFPVGALLVTAVSLLLPAR